MRTLVVGAGGLGGYFGGELLRSGKDVTFLVRPNRARQLRQSGLSVFSPLGDFTVDAPCLVAGEITAPYDVILLTVKAYALPAVMEDFAPAMGPETMIVPVLNGMAHLQTLGERFGAGHVLGGLSMVSSALDAEGNIRHVLVDESLKFGEQEGGLSPRVRALAEAWSGGRFEPVALEAILQDMWEKWMLFSVNACATCLMRASIGDILAAPGGQDFFLQALAECAAVGAAAGHALSPAGLALGNKVFTTQGSPVKASMLRDIERGAPTEGAHVLGELAREARRLGVETPILDLACVHLGAYEAARARPA